MQRGRSVICLFRTLSAACLAPQNFIFFAISSYGSLVNITITTTRKVRRHARALSCVPCS
jgi:hypothetical protein